MARQSKFKRMSVKSLVVLSLMAGTAPIHTYADGTEVQATTQETIFGIPVVGSVNIGNNSYFELKDARLSVGTENNVVTFTVKVVNGGSSDLQFIDYWVRLQSKAGASFTVNIMPQDRDKNVIPAGGSQEIKFYSNVPLNTTLQDLLFRVVVWDWNLPSSDYQRTLGTVEIPASYTTVAPVGAKANIQIARTSLTSSIKKATISRNEEHYLPTVTLELQNTDTRSVKLPALGYMIRTGDGLLYPLQPTVSTENVSIDPLMKKEIILTGKIPRSISEENWQLVVTESVQTGTSGTIQTAVAEMAIPQPAEEPSETEKEQSFSNANGTYVATLGSIQRVPWEDDDLITATITLKSKDEKSLPIPALTGYIKLDDSVKVNVQVVQADNVIGLQPGKEVRFQLLGRIPYTYEFSNLSVHLQEKEQGSGNTETLADLVQFKIPGTIDNVPVVNAGETYNIGGIGRSAGYYVRSFQTFEGKSSDLIAAQIEVENLEKRANELSEIITHFKGADGTIYPASISEIKTKISPSNKALVNIWANVAKSKTNEINQILVGEGITEGKFTPPGGTPDAYVNAVAFNLPEKDASVSKSLQGIQLFPYTINLSKIGTIPEQNQVIIKFDYELDKDASYEINNEDFKIIMELKDKTSDFSVEQVFSLESGDGQVLKLGKEQKEISINSPDFIYKVSLLKKYDLNIYHLFQGQKRLIATKELDWFYYSD